MKRSTMLKWVMMTVMLMGFLSIPTYSYAANNSTSKIQHTLPFTKFKLSKSAQDQAIKKAQSYIVQTKHGYIIKKQGHLQQLLTHKQFMFVKKSIKKSNKMLLSLQKTKKVTMGNNKTYVANIQLKQKSQSTGMISPNISYFYGNIRIYIEWYGYYVYFSHHAIQILKNNIMAFGAGWTGIQASIYAILDIAYDTTPPGWVTMFIAAAYGFGIWNLIRHDHGCGVVVHLRWYSSWPLVFTHYC